MKIIEYSKKYSESVKDLLVELQQHVASIDRFGLNIISPEYREQYFFKTLTEVNQNNGKIFLAINNEEVVGMIACMIKSYDEFDHLDYTCPQKGIITELVTKSTNRKLGVGSLLIQTAEEFLASQKCEYIQLEVFAYNEPAKNFYKKHNYHERCITLFKKLEKEDSHEN